MGFNPVVPPRRKLVHLWEYDGETAFRAELYKRRNLEMGQECVDIHIRSLPTLSPKNRKPGDYISGQPGGDWSWSTSIGERKP
ncbi:MAG: hypothetical protein LBB48_05415 [Treponema sp.]|nr:hypothetical protein [Treponema sp.]